MQKIIVQLELHSVEGILECFSEGVDPNTIFRGKPLIYELVGEYTRTSRFSECVKAFVDYGLELEDKILLAVLLDDAGMLNDALTREPALVEKKYDLESAYTPIFNASLLHICAEFNHLSCAKILVEHGADINSKAGVDVYGFGGQTAIFHTVNQNSNNSIEMLEYLVAKSADLQITVKGFIWGNGYPWETLIPAVNPISYAMMGLLPQMHRNENTISNVVAALLKSAFGIEYHSTNVPCEYLKK
ncbi:MAG: ankyrin repeat domain-containing protein [Ginsengibacter sp.]